MKSKMKRREFIKIAGAGTGAVLAGPKLYAGFNQKDRALIEEGTSRTPTYCEICFWKCAGWVYKKGGKPWKIVGNEDDPNSRGRFCPRGTGGIGAYTNQDRLKKPLLRVEKNGKQVFKEVSWDVALDFIADKMKAIAKKHGPECIALFSHGSGGSYFKIYCTDLVRRMWRLLLMPSAAGLAKKPTC